MKKINVVHIAAEVAPYSQTGGLGVVTRSLSKAIHRLKQHVTVITPLYEKIIDRKKYKIKIFQRNVAVKTGENKEVLVDFYRGYLREGLPIYFIGQAKYFGRWPKIYGTSNDNARYYLFSLAAIELLKILNQHFDVIHCHDWHTGLIPELIKKRNKDKTLNKAATLYTIHNLMYQMNGAWWNVPKEKRDSGTTTLPDLDSEEVQYLNFAKRAIINADLINAVSENYAQEIMTKQYGEDLHLLLKNRQDRLFGVINGIDYDDYNPAKDKNIKQKYNVLTIEQKRKNKDWLQKHCGFTNDPRQPLIAMVARIVEQKGFDLVQKSIDAILAQGVQMALLGDGEKNLITEFKKIEKRNPKQFSVKSYNAHKKHETRYYAGADMILLPSRLEPCGINQLISLRYGCVPIVRKIGGLAETVDNYDPEKKTGNGFVFDHYHSPDMLVAITRAVENFRYPKSWRRLMISGMKISNSWKIPASKYILLYQKAIKEKNEKI
ncbi:MAG: hypothetical protein COX77_04280 [Candidatus Komeilibacteria bacterium CG_4_10_14_0_2_um_filter_37_10]|uniref:Glycogen synthase n=1 Tax=Candidatus Komeilibacteria bacterium CG_4_10_14_0_2_um_filter_37_10 TaxID=1974470 RepID=A0A2M7VDI3_9BACT|nr:MAG: hypothetical protein COX77_04280 [Candidatus Komeilibacteria bacterium CG_4_10_14_0_2_um_filter_37_10]